MKDQLKTIRKGIEKAHIISGQAGIDKALAALYELERMVGQEPILIVQHGEICYKSQDDDQSYGMWCPVTPDAEHGLRNGTQLYTTPPAQQPQYEAGDMASAAAQGFRDGVASVAQQPQADIIKRQANKIAELTADRDGWIEAHARLHREYHDFRKAAPQQAEAVPSDVVRDAERWRTFLATRPANTHAVINDAIDAAMKKQGGGV